MTYTITRQVQNYFPPKTNLANFKKKYLVTEVRWHGIVYVVNVILKDIKLSNLSTNNF